MYDRSTMVRQPATGPAADGDKVVLGTVKVTNADQVFGRPVPLSPPTAELGHQIRLVGAALAADRLRPGDVMRVQVGWQAMVQPSVDYTVFVHVMSGEGHLVAQHDSPPLGGALPTTDWDAGDAVFDAIDVPIPADLPVGKYKVLVGMYRLDTGMRLANTSGVDEFPIGTIVVQ
jgi:hypothetical protein